MNSAYKLMLIVLFLNFPPGVFGCEQEQAPETVEQPTDREEENALARLKPETANEKRAMPSETAGQGRENRGEKTAGSMKKVFWIPNGKPEARLR